MSKTTSSTTITRRQRHKPLEDDISSVGHLRTKSTGKRKLRSDEDGGDGYIDAPSSRKILHLAQDLAEEDTALQNQKLKESKPDPAFDFSSRSQGRDTGGVDEDDDGDANWQDEEEEWMPGEEVEAEDVDPADMALFAKFLPQGSTSTFNPSLPSLTTAVNDKASEDNSPQDDNSVGETTNLAELILARIAEKEALQSQSPNYPPTSNRNDAPPPDAVEIPAKFFDVFTKIGSLLSRYKSGPLPKPFKVLPTLPSWPTLLEITRPVLWTPNAIYAATRIFVSAPASTVQHFLNTVLLDRVRDDIHESQSHKLNVHLYNSLKKSLYKPSAFFKGFLFPLISSGTCTLREAHIISSVLARVSIPVLHSAAALLRICEIAADQSISVNAEAAGAANVFIRVLLDKKYALPYRAVDALVFHFLRFRNSNPNPSSASARDNDIGSGDNDDNDFSMSGTTNTATAKRPKREGGSNSNNNNNNNSNLNKLPVLWHQSLLVFAQRYKNDITEDQREALLDLLLARGHREIGPEVRRELVAGRERGRDVVPTNGDGDGDDTMEVGG